MRYAIVGTGSVGITLASFFAKAGIPVSVTNSRSADAVLSIVSEFGGRVEAASLADALKADVILVAVPFLRFKDLGAALPDWTGKVVVDVTNALGLSPDVLQAELGGHLSSEVNAERVPGAKLVKAFNQLPMKLLKRSPPAGARRVVFVSSDHEDASRQVAKLAENLGFAAIEVGGITEGGRLIDAPNALVFQDRVKLQPE